MSLILTIPMIDGFLNPYRGHVGPLSINRPYRYVDDGRVREGIHQFLAAKLEQSFDEDIPKKEGKTLIL